MAEVKKVAIMAVVSLAVIWAYNNVAMVHNLVNPKDEPDMK